MKAHISQCYRPMDTSVEHLLLYYVTCCMYLLRTTKIVKLQQPIVEMMFSCKLIFTQKCQIFTSCSFWCELVLEVFSGKTLTSFGFWTVVQTKRGGLNMSAWSLGKCEGCFWHSSPWFCQSNDWLRKIIILIQLTMMKYICCLQL